MKRSVTGRLLGRVMGKLQKMQAGYDTPFIEELAAVLGPRGLMRWAGDVVNLIAILEKRYGASEAQLLIGLAAIWNGCHFCSVGHVYAGNLLWFRDRNKLLPLDERELPALGILRDEHLLGRIVGRLERDPDTAGLRDAVRRMFELRTGARTVTDTDDSILRATADSWDLINECSIVVGIDAPARDVPPLAPIAKDMDLRRRYAEARGRPAEAGPGKWG
jgi:hypothetical protein